MIVPAGNSRSQPVGKDLDHSHHWMIETQDGPASSAVCRTCGDKRDFDNAFRRSASWRGVRPVSSSPWQAAIKG